jgi:hypothetical protein
MMRSLLLRVVWLAAPALLALGAGCVEEPRCAEACLHTCEICQTDCAAEDLQACQNTCQDQQTDPARAECVISTQSCDDLWKC